MTQLQADQQLVLFPLLHLINGSYPSPTSLSKVSREAFVVMLPAIMSGFEASVYASKAWRLSFGSKVVSDLCTFETPIGLAKLWKGFATCRLP